MGITFRIEVLGIMCECIHENVILDFIGYCAFYFVFFIYSNVKRSNCAPN